MDWLLDSLRVVREVRDWSVTRPRRDAGAAATRQALESATRELEAYVREQGIDLESVGPRERLLGPSRSPETRFPPASASPRRAPVPVEDPEEQGESIADDRIRADALDPQAVSAIRHLRRFGYKAYLVGGCVRDLLLDLEPKDFDIATDARPEEVKAMFRNARIIGRRFRLVHLYFRGGKVLEVATFRAAAPVAEEESEADTDLLIRRDNVFGTEREDAQRRDFTINALFYDPETERIIDHVGGMPDIDARLVRMIGDPDIRLREDPVRIVRAIRFRAKAGLMWEPELEAALRRHGGELRKCAPARLLEETLKLLRMGHARASFDLMREHGVLEILVPDIEAYVDGSLALLAGAEIEGTAEDRLRDLRSHLDGLDQVVARGPVADDVVLGALLYPLAEAVMAHADAEGRDRAKRLADLLTSVGRELQFTRRLSENLRQCFAIQRQIGSDGRRRRRISPTAMARRPVFPAALRLYEIHARARGIGLEDVRDWEVRAKEEGVVLDGSASRPASPRRRRSGRRRRPGS